MTLASLVFITIAGATVRLTGSGLGCSTWPSCEPDSITPRAESGIHGMIEFGNRLVSGVVGVTSLAAVYGAHRRSPRRPDLVNWSWQVFAWVVVNALVGRYVVEQDLLPATVIVHFLLALTAIWSAVVLHHRASEGSAGEAAQRVAVPRALRRSSHWLLGAAMVTIFVGTLVTGSGPHAGDETADRLELDVGEVARIHGISAVVLLVLALRTSWLAHRGEVDSELTDRLRWLSLVLIGQGIIGYVQYFNGVPELLVGAHVLGAALLWIAVLRVWLAGSPRQPAGPVTETQSPAAMTARPLPSKLRVPTRETGVDARSHSST